MNKGIYTIRMTAVVMMLSIAACYASAQDFLSTKTLTLKKSAGKASYNASVEFPTEGSPAVLASIMQWMNIVLETEGDFQRNFQKLLQSSCDTFFGYGENWKRTVEIVRDYEDDNYVTFVSKVTDVDDEKWIAEDCASFSKKDGHRITLDEIFKCSEEELKQLMWQYRDDIELDVDDPSGLAPMNGGYTDGWILVTSPAHNSTSRSFSLRYEEILSYVNTQ